MRNKKNPKLAQTDVTCPCGRVHTVTVTPLTSLVVIPCGCGALVRWTPEGATAEGVE